MKFSHSIMVTAALAVGVAFSTAWAQNANDATVTALAGNVSYSHGGGGYTPLAVGTRLMRGDVVRTGPSSHCDLQVGHHVGIIQVAPNSTFGITDLTATGTGADMVTDSQFDLSQGAIFAKVTKLSKASRYEIKTPRGIAGVRGSTLYLTANGDLTVGEGTVGIAYPNNGGVQTFVLHSGESISAGDAQPHPASAGVLRDINSSLSDAGSHGIGHDVQPFVPPNETYISPVFPAQ